ncbi:MAG: hypothetical protein EXQ58_08565 [Acidobacteria bacterium]|nr:hypothetical protein [Acidobacteriota bacterium]
MSIAAVIVLVLVILLYGLDYYSTMDFHHRVYHPRHSDLRPTGRIGLRLGMLGGFLFCGLFLYPIRKRWAWLGRLGKTRHWLDFHVLLGITAPIIITFHSSLKFRGLAGIAYWIMIVVALSGFVGRYFYAQLPRSLNAAELSLKEMQDISQTLWQELEGQKLFAWLQLAPLFELPTREEVERMSLGRALLSMLLLDLRRPFLVSALRRRAISAKAMLFSLGGFLPSQNPKLEAAIEMARRQAWIMAKVSFLSKTQQVFHLWHVVHRPFSYSFAVLMVVHIVVAIMLGYF